MSSTVEGKIRAVGGTGNVETAAGPAKSRTRAIQRM